MAIRLSDKVEAVYEIFSNETIRGALRLLTIDPDVATGFSSYANSLEFYRDKLNRLSATKPAWFIDANFTIRLALSD